MKKKYLFPGIVVVESMDFNSLCQTSSSEVTLGDMPETNMDLNF